MMVPPQDFVFIADESGISNDRFTAVGGIVMHRDTLRRAYETLKKYRTENNMNSELKWSKISNQKKDEYIRLVDYFFAMNNTGRMHFHCLFFDSHQWRHNKYNGGDPDVGLSKLYYQLLMHKFVNIYGNKGSLYVRLDHRNSSTPLEDIRRMLNADVAKKHGIHTDPVKQLVSEDSKNCDLLQLNDVILGAACAVRNGRHLLADGKESKRSVALHVLDKSGLTSFERDSPKSLQRFTVWNMRPRKD